MFLAVGGPSESGKSTLVDALCEMFPERFQRPRSFTTRTRRSDRVDEYFEFVSDAEFDTVRDSGGLLQEDHANGNRYGISRDDFEAIQVAGRHPVHEISHANQVRFEAARSDLFRVAVKRSGSGPDPEWPSAAGTSQGYHVEVSMDQSADAAARSVAAKVEAHLAWPVDGPDVREVDATNSVGYSTLADEFDDGRRVTTFEFHELSRPFWDGVLADLPTGSRLVELGPGSGWLMSGRSGRGFKYIGFESAARMVRHGVGDVQFAESLRSIDLPTGTVDMVVGSLLEGALYPLVLAEARRILKAGGTLCVTSPSRDWAESIRQRSNLDRTTFVTDAGEEVSVYSFAHDPATMHHYLSASGFRVQAHIPMSGSNQRVDLSAPAITLAAAQRGVKVQELTVVDGYIAEAI